MPRCTLTPGTGGLALQSPYDPVFVDAFKRAVPHGLRSWDGRNRVWIVDPTAGEAVADLCAKHFGERPQVPALSAAPAAPQVRVITLEYLGQIKWREDGSHTAMGYADGAWSVIASEDVLRAWFQPPTVTAADKPREAAAPDTLYGLLGVAQDADEALIKAGYRRMARQWHPDVCREPDAAAMFLRVKDAYDLLSDPLKRRKYNAGLAFERAQPPARRGYVAPPPPFRAPLRCGLVVAEALPRLGRWELTKILQWSDITDGAGRVMVTSWSTDEERIIVKWVAP